MPEKIEGQMTAAGLRIGIVVSRWNEFVTRALQEGALDTLRRHGADLAEVRVVHVPGSFEIPMALQALAQTGNYDALIALGAVIRGATSHYDLIASAVTNGVSRVALDTAVPIAFGVLTTETLEQAIERSGSKAGNKGSEAALVAIEMANLMRQLKD